MVKKCVLHSVQLQGCKNPINLFSPLSSWVICSNLLTLLLTSDMYYIAHLTKVKTLGELHLKFAKSSHCPKYILILWSTYQNSSIQLALLAVVWWYSFGTSLAANFIALCAWARGEVTSSYVCWWRRHKSCQILRSRHLKKNRWKSGFFMLWID